VFLRLKYEVKSLKVKVAVDGKDIPVNEFVNQILSSMISGAVMTLKGVKSDWNTIEIRVLRDG